MNSFSISFALLLLSQSVASSAAGTRAFLRSETIASPSNPPSFLPRNFRPDLSARQPHEPAMTVEVLEDGLVVIRNFLSLAQQKQMAKGALQWGDRDSDGFFEVDQDGERKLNADSSRGRIYDAVTRFPKWAPDHARLAHKLAQLADPTMPDMEPTHLLLNMYTTSNGLVWHRDIYENDGKSDHPVINLCIGASCRFAARHEDEPGVEGDTEREIILNSGDCLLFGGKCRFIKHAVLEVMMDTCPDWMETPCRFSFTFRDAPEVLGREHEFKFFKPSVHLVGQDEFKQPIDADSFKGLPSQASQCN